MTVRDLIVSGRRLFSGNADHLWKMLGDRQELAKVIPGCENITRTCRGHYQIIFNSPIASVQGRYVFGVEVVENLACQRLSVLGNGSASGTNVKFAAFIEVEDRGNKALVRWRTRIEVEGELGGLDPKILRSMVKMIADKLFDGIKDITEQTS